MNPTPFPVTSSTPARDPGIEGYYRLHAGIYDATRWSFLFGRSTILRCAAAAQPAPARILEVGCGTGRNLLALARIFPRAQITGVDLSASMLAIARRKTAAHGSRIRLLQRAYDAPVSAAQGHQLVLCSYALTMFNPGFEAAIAAAHRDLAPGGHLAVVDFDATRFRWFARWMGFNHVRMDGQLRPLLHEKFSTVTERICPAYGGVWDYLLFVGRKA
jgi:S-adenosylmethionine-diacylgycerolhomoserine-N-methlytransferase